MPSSAAARLPAPAPTPGRSDAQTLRRLLPYLWTYRWRVAVALLLMVAAKLATVGVPLLLKALVDALTPLPGLSAEATAALVVPVGLLLAYGGLRLGTTLLAELRELVFLKATEGATRTIALQVFEHLHALSLRFHLERQTGALTRDIERGTRAVQSLVSYSLYSVVPTLVEVALVLAILGLRFEAWYVWTTLAALLAYVVFTVQVTQWRTHIRRQMNELESASQARAIDALLNYETVKYFDNEAWEARRYADSLERLRRARVRTQASLSLLNVGQQLIIAVALVSWPIYARLVRANVLALREREFVEAARALGASRSRLMLRHLLPNTLTPIFVQASFDVGGAILTAAGLSFIGFGAQPPTPEWGAMVSETRSYIAEAIWAPAAPAIGILLTVLAFNLLGDALRDVLDPRGKD